MGVYEMSGAVAIYHSYAGLLAIKSICLNKAPNIIVFPYRTPDVDFIIISSFRCGSIFTSICVCKLLLLLLF